MGTIVVGLDGSESSREAFHVAVQEAVFRQGTVLAVHAFHYPVMTGYEMIVGEIAQFQTQAEQWVAEEISHLAESYEVDFPVKVETRISSGHFGRELLDASRDAEMLVLGSRGLGGFRGLLLGSVSTYCVHHVTCPLLIVPTHHTDEE